MAYDKSRAEGAAIRAQKKKAQKAEEQKQKDSNSGGLPALGGLPDISKSGGGRGGFFVNEDLMKGMNNELDKLDLMNASKGRAKPAPVGWVDSHAEMSMDQI